MITGIHHVCMKCDTKEDYEKVIEFYTQTLGLPVKRQWPEGIMFDAGNTLIEVFANGADPYIRGTIRHFAFATDNVDELAKKVKAAGYNVFIEPKDIVIHSEPELPARIAFFNGPIGEEIELFQEK